MKILFLLLMVMSATKVHADEPLAGDQSLADKDATEQVIQQAEKLTTIDITDRVADTAIASRILKILQTSQWFTSLDVSVTEGIVVLEGETQKREYRQWAETIAARTQGVVAVINKLTLADASDNSLAPVIDESRDFINRSIAALPIILSSLLVLILSLIIAKYVSSLSFRIFSGRIQSAMLRRLVARIFAVPFLIIGVYIILNITGLGTLATTVIGGTGLIGLILGFAFRDIAENFLASILISIQRPFLLGDTIKVLDFVGVVQAVTTRGTVIMTLEGNHVQIPNSIIYKEAIVNFTANPNIRLDFAVGIGYDASISNAQAIALQILLEHPAVLRHPESWVLAEALSASTVTLRLYFWVDSKTHNILKVKSAIIRIVKSTFMQNNISMPDDAREVIFPQGIHVTTEVSGGKEVGDRKAVSDRIELRDTKELSNKKEPGDSSITSTPEFPQIKTHSTDKTAATTANDTSVCTTAEGQLATDVPMIEQQAQGTSMGERSENLLK